MKKSKLILTISGTAVLVLIVTSILYIDREKFPTNSTTSSSSFPFATYGNFSAQVVSVSPITVAVSKTSGMAYGIFRVSGGYQLRVSPNFINWRNVSSNVVPHGYVINIPKDLAVTNSGTIIVSAARKVVHLNTTIFRASFDDGQTFSTVLNVTLMGHGTESGQGFWHGIAETSNGTLFAGLYNPQSLVYKSVDEGHTWSLVFNGSDTGSGWQNEIHDVEVNQYRNYIYVITDDESGTNNNRTIWLSTDYGNHWKLLWAQALKLPGSNLPKDYVPLAFGFLDYGNIAALGLDSHNTYYMYLFQVRSDGTLWEYERLNVSSSIADPFYTTWITSVNPKKFLWATIDSLRSPVLGAGMYAVTSNGTIIPLLTVHGTTFGIGILEIAGRSISGYYAAIARASQGLYLIVFNE